MTMRFDFADFSRRFSLNDILRPMSIAEQRQADLERQKAAYFAQGGTISVCPPPLYAPRKEAPRKPHPEALVRQKTVKKVGVAYSSVVPDGMLSIGPVAAMCGLNSTQTPALRQIRAAVEMKLLVPDLIITRSNKPLLYFWPATVNAFIEKGGIRLLRMPRTSLSKVQVTELLERVAKGQLLRHAAFDIEVDYKTAQRGIAIVQEFGMSACRE